jgi:hypothetical protein
MGGREGGGGVTAVRRWWHYKYGTEYHSPPPPSHTYTHTSIHPHHCRDSIAKLYAEHGTEYVVTVEDVHRITEAAKQHMAQLLG